MDLVESYTDSDEDLSCDASYASNIRSINNSTEEDNRHFDYLHLQSSESDDEPDPAEVKPKGKIGSSNFVHNSFWHGEDKPLIVKRKSEQIARKDDDLVSHGTRLEAKRFKQSPEEVYTSAIFSPCNLIINSLSSGRKTSLSIPKHREKSVSCDFGALNSIAWAPSKHSHLLASANMSSDVAIWNCVGSERLFLAQRLRYHTKAVKDVAWSACEKLVFSCGYDGRAIVSDVETGNLIRGKILAFSKAINCS